MLSEEKNDTSHGEKKFYSRKEQIYTKMKKPVTF
jgi:hypothetical protein